jgi:hypothetical protein
VENEMKNNKSSNVIHNRENAGNEPKKQSDDITSAKYNSRSAKEKHIEKD